MTRYQAYPGRNGLSERAPSQATDDAGQFGWHCRKRSGAATQPPWHKPAEPATGLRPAIATLSSHRVATSRREAAEPRSSVHCSWPVGPRIRDEQLWAGSNQKTIVKLGGVFRTNGGAVMKSFLLWIAVPMMLLGAGMLVAGIGSTAQWIAVIAVGIAFVAIGQGKPGSARRR